MNLYSGVANHFLYLVNFRSYKYLSNNISIKIGTDEAVDLKHGTCSIAYYLSKDHIDPHTFKIVINKPPEDLENKALYHFKLPAHELRHAFQMNVGLPLADRSKFNQFGEDGLPQEIDARFFQETAYKIYQMALQADSNCWKSVARLFQEVESYNGSQLDESLECQVCDLMQILISFHMNKETDSLIRFYLYTICWEIETLLILRYCNMELYSIDRKLQNADEKTVEMLPMIDKRIHRLQEQIHSNVNDDFLLSKLHEAIGYYLKRKIEIIVSPTVELSKKEEQFSIAVVESLLSFKNAYLLYHDSRFGKYIAAQITYLAQALRNGTLQLLADKVYCVGYFKPYIEKFGYKNREALKDQLTQEKWENHIKERTSFFDRVRKCKTREDVLLEVNSFVQSQSIAKDLLVGGAISLYYEQGENNGFSSRYARTSVSDLACLSYDFAVLFRDNCERVKYHLSLLDIEPIFILSAADTALRIAKLSPEDEARTHKKSWTAIIQTIIDSPKRFTGTLALGVIVATGFIYTTTWFLLTSKTPQNRLVESLQPNLQPGLPTSVLNSFPKANCGDPRPDDPTAYPVSFYPVYVDFTESNLRAIKSDFCRNAFPRSRTSTGERVIQVASFTNLERANSLKELMVQRFGSGEVGKPTVIPSKN